MKKIILVLITLILLFSSCKKEKAKKEEAPELGQIFKKGMVIEATNQGRLEWKMKAKTLIQKEKHVKRVFGEEIKLFLHNSNEKVIIKITSNRGEANLTNNNVVLKGNVKLINKQNNTKLYTDILHYDSDKQKIFTKSEVKIVRDGSEINGKGMTANLKMDEVVLKETYGKK